MELTARVAASPEDAGLHNDLGNLLARRGFAHEAIDQYRKAAKLDPHFYLGDYNEGLLLEKEGRDGDAISAYKRSIKRKPGFPLSRFHLGFLYEKGGNNSGAVTEYSKALRIDPSLRWPARNPLVIQTRLLTALLSPITSATWPVPISSAKASSRIVPSGKSSSRASGEHERAEPESRPEDGDRRGCARDGSAGGAPIIGGKPSSAGPYDPRRQPNDQFHRARPGRPNQPPSRTTVPPLRRLSPRSRRAPPETRTLPIRRWKNRRRHSRSTARA